MKNNLSFGLALVILLLVSSFPAFAVEQHGSISGVITDNEGLALPGVQIVLESSALQGQKTFYSDENGKFHAPLLPYGEYTATTSMIGYKTVKLENVKVRLGENTSVTVQMSVAAFEEVLTVVAPMPVVDISKPQTAISLDTEDINKMPWKDRRYQQMYQLAAGVTKDEDNDMNPAVHGSTNRDNLYLVDGVDTTDPVTGTWSSQINVDAIETVEVQTGGFSAEYGRASGAVTNVVTKSGSNEFHGSLQLYAEDYDWYANSDTPTGTEKITEYRPSFTLGGPIVKDRLWFFTSLERRDQETNTFVLAENGEITTKYEGWYVLGKLTFRVNDNNDGAFQFTMDPINIENASAKFGTDADFTVAESQRKQEQGGYFYQLKWNSIFTKDMFLTLKSSYSHSELNSFPMNREAGPGHRDLYSGFWYMGAYDNEQYSDRDRTEVSGILNYHMSTAHGDHDWKFGAEYHHLLFNTSSFIPIYDVTDPYVEDVIDDLGGWGQDWGYYYLDRNQIGDPDYQRGYVVLKSEPQESECTADIYTFFVEDSWKINDYLTFIPGLRYEYTTQESDTGEEVVKWDDLLAPRVGLTYDLLTNGKSKLSASYARYYDTAFLNIANYVSAKDTVTSYYRWYPEYGQYLHYFDTGGPSNNTIDPNLDAVFTDEYIVGFELEVAKNYSAGIRGVYKCADNFIEDVNVDPSIVWDPVLGDWTYEEGHTDHFEITNMKQAEFDYKGLELTLQKRFSDNYQFITSYTLSRAEGWHDSSGGSMTSTLGDSPEMDANRDGNLPWDRRHVIKFNGSYRFPYDFIVGASFLYQSGAPYSKIAEDLLYGNFYYYLESQGNYRENSNYQLDLHVEKSFCLYELPNGPLALVLYADIYNVTNVQRPVRSYQYANRDGTNLDVPFGSPIDYQDPLKAMLAAKLTF